MNFKLKYHISATTTLDLNEIIERAELELKDKKYNIESVTYTSISFYDNPWRLRWNFEPLMLDAGEFAIGNTLKGEKLVTLTYYWKYYQFLLTYAFLTIIVFSQKAYFEIWFFSAFYAITVPIDIARTKGKARALLANVLKTDS